MEAFIVRPFGTKEVIKRDKATGQTKIVSLNFDNVETALITPALEAVNLTGGTTGKIFEAGDIREDMFSLLLLADVVVADITIHNANVFYELGIRHALRDKKTILLKCAGFDETPFDILAYRYVSYDKDNPAAALDKLVKALQDTLLADRIDSPVFDILPWLKPTDTEQFLIVPSDFMDEVTRYVSSNQTDRLALLAEEVRGFVWEVPALRVIGEGQFQLKLYEGAKQTWEQIRKRKPGDQQANDRLSTLYSRLAEVAATPVQRLEYLALSDQTLTQLLTPVSTPDAGKKAEFYSLRARNAKSRWVVSWSDKQTDSDRQIAALMSPFLKQTYEDYERGFTEDLNHFYSGSNALGFLSILITLAEGHPDAWELEYESTAKAQQALQDYKERHEKLGIVVTASLEAAQKRLKLNGKTDPWVAITLADVSCLLLKRAERVGLLYKQALSALKGFNLDAARRQLVLYKQLAILPDNVEAALKQFPPDVPVTTAEKPYYMLFTGHMIDKKSRKDAVGAPAPRFPPEKETSARQAIYAAVAAVQKRVTGPLVGLAGGACGGDILFHEVCRELGIKTQLLLGLPRDQYVNTSVQFAGANWVERFDNLYKRADPEWPVEVLADSKELPGWLRKKQDYSLWERANLWMLHKALANGGQNMMLIALWDGEAGDGVGGTEHLVTQAQARGAQTLVIDVKDLT